MGVAHNGVESIDVKGQVSETGGRWGRAPPAFHTFAKDMYLIEANTFYIKTMYYLFLPITNIPASPSQIYPVAFASKTKFRLLKV